MKWENQWIELTPLVPDEEQGQGTFQVFISDSSSWCLWLAWARIPASPLLAAWLGVSGSLSAFLSPELENGDENN